MKANTIVVSVGTSLLGNLMAMETPTNEIFGSAQAIQAFKSHLHNPGRSIKDETAKERKISDLLGKWPVKIRGMAFDKYLEFFDDEKIAANIKNRGERQFDRLPAEISTLFLYYYDVEGNLRERFLERLAQSEDRPGKKNLFEEKDRVVLLCTDTVDSVFCAAVIRQMLGKSSWFKTKCSVLRKDSLPEEYREIMLDSDGVKFIPKLDVYCPEQWVGSKDIDSDTGIRKFGIGHMLDWFRIMKKKGLLGSRDALLRTGGYKEMSADLKMLAMQFQLESFYLFERSDVLIQVYTGGWPKDFSIVAGKSERSK